MEDNNLNVYSLSRNIFDWGFENPELITPTHIAMYFFIIEHCNRLGWKEKFGLPTTMVNDAIGIKNFRTYTNTLNDLVEWGFIKMIEKSKNQYSSNIIAIVKNAKASTKALDKALQKHSTKHCKSIVSIDKQDTSIQNTNIQEYRKFAHLKISFDEVEKIKAQGYLQNQIDGILDSIENYKKNTSYTSLYLTALKWLKKEYPSVVSKSTENIEYNYKFFDIPITEEYNFTPAQIIEFCKQGKYQRL